MKWIRRVCVALVPLLPVAARVLYFPIDQGFTVKRLGCACHPGFNANVFNVFILCPIVLAISAILLLLAAQRLTGKWKWIYIAGGLAFQFATGWGIWRACVWL